MGTIVRDRGDGEHGPLNQLSRTRMGPQKLKQQAQVLHWSVLGVPNICYGCWLGTPNSGYQCAADFFACSWYSFHSTGVFCPGLIRGLLPYLIAFCSFVFGWDLLETCPFLKRKWKGVDMEDRGSGEKL